MIYNIVNRDLVNRDLVKESHMFIGREKELEILRKNYEYDGFKMLILYGRRRTGKSYLLQHFFQSLNTKVIAFQALQNRPELSIEAFKLCLLEVFPTDLNIEMKTWRQCFRYLNSQLNNNEKITICIDEINYIFKSDSSFASQLQEEIDYVLRNKNVFLIVCGSNITSIEENILNDNAPLYGRRNASIKLEEFSYLEAAYFYNNYSFEDRVIAYSVFGGKGKNLDSIDNKVSIKENIISEILTPGGSLADEIDLLLKDDFREPEYYKEIMYTISLGNNSFNEIKNQMNADSAVLATYLKNLIQLKIIDKREIIHNKNSKDYRYYISDNFFDFYFKFVYKRKSILNILISPETFYEKFIEKDLLTYVGIKFEKICEQYLVKKAYDGQLDFIPLSYGKYFGKKRNGETFDIDIVLKDDNHLLASECKFTNKAFDQSDMNELIDNAKTLNIPDIEYYIFVKKAVDKKVYEQHAKMHCIYLEDLYE